MRKTLQRILAILGVVFLLGLVILTLVFAITGSPYFMASLVSMLLLPIFIYGYMILYKAIHPKDDEEKKDL